MADIAKSDLFFLITTLAVVVLSIIIAFLLIYIFIIVRDVKEVVRKVKEESTEMIGDIKDLRIRIKEGKGVISHTSAIIGFFKKAFLGKRTHAKKSKE